MKNKKNLLIALLMLIFSLCACVTEHVHFFTEKVIPPTCTDVGYTLYKCRCGEEYKDNETGALGHDYEEIDIKPTCLSTGYTLHKCKLCSSEYRDKEVKKTDHEYGEWYIVKEATEHEKGLKEKKCIYCDNKIEETIDELPHSHVFSDWKVLVNETSSNPGLKERKCEGCGHIEQTTVVDLSDMELVLDKTYFMVNLNETFTEVLSGVITDGKKTYQLNSDEIYVSRNAYKKLGIYSLSVTAIYHDYRFRQDIELEVKNYLNEEEKIKLSFINKINYLVEHGDYLYLCDDSYIYRYDLMNYKLDGKLYIKDVANSHCIYGEYLYISAHDKNLNFYSKDKDCRGSIIQIDLNTFTIFKQVNVDDLFPYSIAVDKRGNVMFGRGNNGWGYLMLVDMDSGETKRIFDSHSLNVFVYNEEADVIIEYDLDTTMNFVVHNYWESRETYTDTINETLADLQGTLKIEDNIIISDACMYYYEFDTLKPGSNDCFNSYDLRDGMNKSYDYLAADIDEQNIYFVCEKSKKKFDLYDKIILKTILRSEEYEKFDVKMTEECDVLCVYSHNDKIYLVTSLNELFVLKNR